MLTNTGETPVMHWDRHTLTAFAGIAALLIGWALLLEDAVSFVPETAMIGGIAAIALAGLERLKQRVEIVERRPVPRSPRRCGSRRLIGCLRRSAADRVRPRQEMRRRQPLRPCLRALAAWSSSAGAEPRG
jgi:hypothetical protein